MQCLLSIETSAATNFASGYLRSDRISDRVPFPEDRKKCEKGKIRTGPVKKNQFLCVDISVLLIPDVISAKKKSSREKRHGDDFGCTTLGTRNTVPLRGIRVEG